MMPHLLIQKGTDDKDGQSSSTTENAESDPCMCGHHFYDRGVIAGH